MTDVSLTPVWTVLIGVAVFFYVVLDGFDLGVGVLYAFVNDRERRTLVMNSIAPIWDGNETWLILGSVGLFTAFPVAFAIIVPAVYFPALMMLLGLAFRGVAFEYRVRGAQRRTIWDWGFALGSALAAFAQGVMLGAVVQGFKVDGRVFAGSSFDCFNTFTAFTGLSLVAGYAVLGAAWLVIKLEGDAQTFARRAGRRALALTVIGVIGVSLWTPLIDSDIADRWFRWPNIALLAPVPVLTALCVWALDRAFEKGRDGAPFLIAVLLFLLCYAGIAISRWPWIVPGHFTFDQAAAAPNAQAFLLVGTLLLLPVVLLYTAWSYWVFRGKARADLGYHPSSDTP